MDTKWILKVKTGSYQTADGATKSRYLEIGRIVEGDRGPFMLLSRVFSPSGVDVEIGRDSILVSMFEPREFEDDIPVGRKPVPF